MIIRSAFKKPDFETQMRLIHYIPGKSHGRWYIISLGLFVLVGGVILLFLKGK